MCKNSSILPSTTARGNLELSEKLFKQYCVGWKLGGITPLLTKATTCSSSSRHCWEDSLSYSWSRLIWVAACFSPKKISIKIKYTCLLLTTHKWNTLNKNLSYPKKIHIHTHSCLFPIMQEKKYPLINPHLPGTPLVFSSWLERI